MQHNSYELRMTELHSLKNLETGTWDLYSSLTQLLPGVSEILCLIPHKKGTQKRLETRG